MSRRHGCKCNLLQMSVNEMIRHADKKTNDRKIQWSNNSRKGNVNFNAPFSVSCFAHTLFICYLFSFYAYLLLVLSCFRFSFTQLRLYHSFLFSVSYFYFALPFFLFRISLSDALFYTYSVLLSPSPAILSARSLFMLCNFRCNNFQFFFGFLYDIEHDTLSHHQ
jgi:hypothetical protein